MAARDTNALQRRRATRPTGAPSRASIGFNLHGSWLQRTQALVAATSSLRQVGARSTLCRLATSPDTCGPRPSPHECGVTRFHPLFTSTMSSEGPAALHRSSSTTLASLIFANQNIVCKLRVPRPSTSCDGNSPLPRMSLELVSRVEQRTLIVFNGRARRRRQRDGAPRSPVPDVGPPVVQLR